MKVLAKITEMGWAKQSARISLWPYAIDEEWHEIWLFAETVEDAISAIRAHESIGDDVAVQMAIALQPPTKELWIS